MREYDDFQDDDQNTPGTGDEESPPMRKLREQNEKLTQQVKTLPELQRQLAVYKLGLNPETPQVKLFLRASDIDFSDLDKVKEAATEYELIQAEGDSQTEEQAQEQEAHGRVSGAGAGAGAPDGKGEAVDYGQAKTEAEVIAMVQAQGGQVWDD